MGLSNGQPEGMRRQREGTRPHREVSGLLGPETRPAHYWGAESRSTRV